MLFTVFAQRRVARASILSSQCSRGCPVQPSVGWAGILIRVDPGRGVSRTLYCVALDEDPLKPNDGLNGGTRPPVSLAFTLLLGHATVIDRSLFSGSADRNMELEKWSGMPVGPAFMDFALTHELGHGICQEKNERLANEYGKELREGKVPHCRNAAGLEVGRARK